MTDILGPADAPNAVAIRPTETRSFPVNDSWFRDCSSPTADDGTDINAAFLNGAVAALRALVRINGGTIVDPTVKIVPEVGTDDNLLAKAVQHLIQRGQTQFGPDTGAANALVVTLSPAPPELKAGMTVRTKVAFDTSGAATMNVNGTGAKPIVHPDGSATLPFDLIAGEYATFNYDDASGGRWQKVGLSGLVLTAPRTYYVDGALGSDANKGLAAGAGNAFATIQKAVNTAAKFNLNGFNVTIVVADWIGNQYAPASLGAINGSGTITIQGNTGTPANVEIHAATGPAVQCSGAGYTLRGIKVTSAAADVPGVRPSAGVWAPPGGVISVENCEFGSCLDAHLYATGGTISYAGAIKISGNTSNHIIAAANGYVYSTGNPGPTLNIPSAVSITAFVRSTMGSTVISSYLTITGGSNVTGSKFAADTNGVINTATGGNVNFLPGTTAGTTATGGQYA